MLSGLSEMMLADAEQSNNDQSDSDRSVQEREQNPEEGKSKLDAPINFDSIFSQGDSH